MMLTAQVSEVPSTASRIRADRVLNGGRRERRRKELREKMKTLSNKAPLMGAPVVKK